MASKVWLFVMSKSLVNPSPYWVMSVRCFCAFWGHVIWQILGVSTSFEETTCIVKWTGDSLTFGTYLIFTLWVIPVLRVLVCIETVMLLRPWISEFSVIWTRHRDGAPAARCTCCLLVHMPRKLGEKHGDWLWALVCGFVNSRQATCIFKLLEELFPTAVDANYGGN